MNRNYNISVVIVTYNASKYIVPCIKSIFTSYGVTIDEIIVIDNASNDDTIHRIGKYFSANSKIKIIELRKNVGFPLACNIGVANARNRFIVLMNPDVVVKPDCFVKLAEAMINDEKIAVVQPKILHPGNFIDSAGGLMDLLGHGFHIGKFESDRGQYDRPRDILYACFACAMIRRDVYLRLGGMDSRYFLYNDDLDFCLRCWLAGYRVVYVPDAVVYHVGQHATRKLPYHATYFGRRNRLYTLFTIYPVPLNVLASLLLLGLYVGLGVFMSTRDKIEARLTLRIVSKFFKDLKYLTRKRVNLIRKRKFLELARSNLIEFKLVGLRLYLAKLYRRQLGLK